MYSLNQVIKGIARPDKIFWELNNYYHRNLLRRTGVDVMRQDWDNLIILDACRFDLFDSLNPIEGDLTEAISKGSSTREFLRNNFYKEQYRDSIYISANPQVQNHNIDQKFYDRRRLWETHWDNDVRAVRPCDVASETLTTYKNNQHKRLIIHFIQPHYPFIGKKGQQIQHGTLTGNGIISQERDYSDIWTKLSEEKVQKDAVWEAYRENLELAFPSVRKLVNKLNGKTVVTSDHGNAFGRFGIYGHPGNRFISELVKVPWLVTKHSKRRRIKSGDIKDELDSDSTVKKRLRELGYS